MFKRMIQEISQLFTNRQLGTTSTGIIHASEPCATRRSMGGELKAGSGRQSYRPPTSFPNSCPRMNGYSHTQCWDETSCHQNATQLLEEGRLQIGITGFNDTAFKVSFMGRHDAPQLAVAIINLPCKVKMVAERNIADGLLAALRTLDTPDIGRRGIVVVTSGDSPMQEKWTNEIAESAARCRIGIHVICLGAKPDDITCGPRISTKDSLGYGGFHVVKTNAELLAAIRTSLDGLTPAFGMKGTNKAVILVDCSETMVESYRNTTRIEMVIASLQEFLKNPLIRSNPVQWANNIGHNSHPFTRSKPLVGRAISAFATTQHLPVANKGSLAVGKQARLREESI